MNVLITGVSLSPCLMLTPLDRLHSACKDVTYFTVTASNVFVNYAINIGISLADSQHISETDRFLSPALPCSWAVSVGVFSLPEEFGMDQKINKK